MQGSQRPLPALPSENLGGHNSTRQTYSWRQRLYQPVQHFSGPRDHQPVGMRLPFLGIDPRRIEISQVGTAAALLRNPRRQRHADPRILNTAGRIIGPLSLDVRRMRQNATGILTETVPLLRKVIP